jgi:hypothetical protein
VSYTSVHRIMNGNRPCKSNRPKERAEFFDDYDYCVIKKQSTVRLFTHFTQNAKYNNNL